MKASAAKRLALLGLSVIVCAAFVTGLALRGHSWQTVAESSRRLAYIGGPLLEVMAPEPDQILAGGAVDILVHFSPGAPVAVETFRCQLNGRDVTARLTLGENGAYGRLVGLVEGANTLHLEVFGRTLWGDRYVQDRREVRFRVRAYSQLDWA